MSELRHSTYSRKIVDLGTLHTHRQHARANGKTVVHCHGCFDIVHPGHIRYLQFAKQQGDLLIVSLTGDPHVNKGESRPYVPQELRAENLAALEFVDFVFINPTANAVDLLSAVRPDIYLKGREYEHNQHPGFLKEKQTVESYGGRVMFSSGEVVYSSSHLIDNYAQRLDLQTEKLALFCRRYDICSDTIVELMDDIVDRPYLVIGDAVLDRYRYCDASDLSTDAPILSLTPLETRDFLGGAAMTARHLAGLGAEVTLIASFGRDENSDETIDGLEAAGVHVLPIRNRRRIATKTRFVVDTQKMFLLDESPAVPTDSASERWMLEQITRLADNRASLILHDAGLGLFSDSLSHEMIHQARTLYRTIVGGTAGSRGRLIRFNYADALLASERGVRVAMRDQEQGLSALAYRLLTETRAKNLLVSLGRKGLLAFDQLQATTDNWEGNLRSEYLAESGGSAVDRLGFEEAMLATVGGMLGAGANLHQAAYVGTVATSMIGSEMGQHPLDGHTLREVLTSRLSASI